MGFQMFLVVLCCSVWQISAAACSFDFSAPINQHCLCRVGWACISQSNSCLTFSHVHVTMTGSIEQRVGYKSNCSDCHCQHPQINSQLADMATALHADTAAHVWDDDDNGDRYRIGHLYSWGKGLSKVLSKEECEARFGKGSVRCRPKIFGLGLSKTGTHSLFRFFRLLGLPGSHFAWRMFGSVKSAPTSADRALHLDDVGGWVPLLGNSADLAHITDLPIASFPHTLASYYPRAQFVLSVRELHSWWASYKSHLARSEIHAGADFLGEEGLLSNFVYGQNCSKHPWVAQHAAMRHVAHVLSMIHPTRLLQVNLVNSIDRRLVELELCHLAQAVSTAKTAAKEHRNICHEKARTAHEQPPDFEHGQAGVADTVKSLLRFKEKHAGLPDLLKHASEGH
eukprot:m.293144 g.293144  ORF g.293144 m.293144 type:complete len:397 (+) comp18630_c0_seq1:1696-2886(+)